jgi:hypothetical protein
MALAGTATTVASAQFVQGNEAVTIKPDGSRVVETPPLPKSGTASRSKPCHADEGCHGGAWLMVETDAGLRECTEPYARAGSCRASTYGSTRLLRLWVVKANGQWLQCQRPDLSSKCVDMFARPPKNLPFPAVQ